MGHVGLGSLATGQRSGSAGGLRARGGPGSGTARVAQQSRERRLGTGDQAAAEQQFREALRIQPGVAEWRLNLARVLATRGEIPEARFQFEQAIRLKPDAAQARLDYARLLADRRELAAAIRQLETAVRLQPDLWRAHFELAIALGQSGNTTAAREQLTIAANGSDAEVRAQALDVLQKLGQ